MSEWRLYAAAVSVVLAGSVHLGYLASTANSASLVMQAFLANSSGAQVESMPLLWSAFSGCLTLSGALGCLLAPTLAEQVGRRVSLVLNSLLALASLSMAVAAVLLNNHILLFVHRVCMGVVCSAGMTLQSIFISETAPEPKRGPLNSLHQAGIQLGFVIGLIVAVPQLLGSVGRWHLLYVFEIVVFLVPHLAAVLFFLHEPAGYLLRRNRLEDAKRSIQFYHAVDAAEAALICDKIQAQQGSDGAEMSLRTIGSTPVIRHSLCVNVLVAASAAFSGIFAMNYFCVELLVRTGFSPAAAANLAILIGVAGLVACGVSCVAVERWGRRPLLILTTAGCALANLLMMILTMLFQADPAPGFGYGFILAETFFYVSFLTGVGAIFVFLVGEMVPSTAAAKCQGVVISSYYVGAFVAPLIFLPLYEAVGGWSFLLFIVPTTLCCLLWFWLIPETKGKSSEQVMLLLVAKHAWLRPASN